MAFGPCGSSDGGSSTFFPVLRPFPLQFFRKLEIALVFWNRNVERDEVDSPSDRLIAAAKCRFMITGDHQLELRLIFEKILPHEPGGDPIAAGHRLDLRLGPPP